MKYPFPNTENDPETKIWRWLFFFLVGASVALFAAMILTGCTTVRPLTVQEVAAAQAKRIRDTLERQISTSYITNPEKLVPVPGRRDTVVNTIETRIETKVLYFDSSKIAPVINEAIAPLISQIATLQSTVYYLANQHRAGSDSVKAIKAKLDTTVKEAEGDKAIAQATKTFFDGTFYLYLLFILGALAVYLRYRIAKRKVAARQAVMINKT